MFKVAVAHSLELDSAEAVADVLEQCKLQLGDSRPQAGLLFTGIDHDHALVLKEIHTAYPGIELIGCTTDGEMSSVHGYADDSIVLTAFCSDELDFKAGVADSVSHHKIKTIRDAVRSTVSAMRQEPVLCIITPSGLTASGDIMLEGLKSGLGDTFPIFGGAAADQVRLQHTCQFNGDTVYKDALPFLLIGGPLTYACGVQSGWSPIGSKEKVRESTDNIVSKIGAGTAVQYYEHYLGEEIGAEGATTIGDYPLAIFEEDSDSYYLRAASFWDRDSGCVTFLGNVPEGSMVQFTHATRNEIVAATDQSITQSFSEYSGTEPLAALCFSCAARKLVLGTRVEEEYLAFKNSYPTLPVAGFYTYGEYAPLRRGRQTRYHASTFVNLIMGVK